MILSAGEPIRLPSSAARSDGPFHRVARSAAKLAGRVFTTGPRVDELSIRIPDHFRTECCELLLSEWVQLAGPSDLSEGMATAAARQFSLTASRSPTVFYARRDGDDEMPPSMRAGIVRRVHAARSTAELPLSAMDTIALRSGLVTPGQLEGHVVVGPRQQQEVIAFVQQQRHLGLWAEIEFTPRALELIRTKGRTRLITRLRLADAPTITGVFLA